MFANGAASAAFAAAVTAGVDSYYSENPYPDESYTDFMYRTRGIEVVAFEDVSQFVDGALSYPRGIYRAFRYEARLMGYMGPGEAYAAQQEQKIMGQVMGEALKNPEAVKQGAVYAFKNHTARLAGRSAAALATNFVVGPYIGTSGAVLATYGDAMYAIEMGKTTVQEVMTGALAAPD